MKNFLIIMKGSGEVVQGYALGKNLISKGQRVLFAVVQKINSKYFPLDLNVYQCSNVKELLVLVNKLHPDAIIFCNSKIFSDNNDFILKSPFSNIKIFTLDSNWLFNTTNSNRYPYIKWADRYYLNFPKKVFYLGLKEQGGYFDIPSGMLKKIEVVGLIPSYKKIPNKQEKYKIRRNIGIHDDEKMIFCYFSGYGATSRDWVFYKLFRIINKMRSKYKIKIVWVGCLFNESLRYKKDWVINLQDKDFNMDSFFTYLASSDLVFQHQGLGTLEQAVSAQRPVITNVWIDHQRVGYANLHPGEVGPYDRLNLCKMFYKYSSDKEVSNWIQKLLYDEIIINKMRSSQKENYEDGEENMSVSLLKSFD